MAEQNKQPNNVNVVVNLALGVGGKPSADSRDVAGQFEKQHAHVLRSIDDLISQAPEVGSNFGEISYTDPMNRKQRCFTMDRDGFTLLAMGFTGEEALKWKILYIQAFNAMEAKIASEAMYAIPQTYAAALRELADMSEENIRLTQEKDAAVVQVTALQPSADALARIAIADGSLCVTDAAKSLQIQPQKLFKHMRTNRWLYTRPGTKEEIAYQHRIQSGLMEHKIRSIIKPTGEEKVVTCARVTPSGIIKLAKELGVEIPKKD